MRALVFAALAHGTSTIENALKSTDTDKMLAALRLLGIKIEESKNLLQIQGGLQTAEDVIDAGNSGIILRFLGAVAALLPTYTVITGDESIRHRRLVIPLLEGLTQLGAFATTLRGDGFAPIMIKGPLRGGIAEISGEDSQPVSGLLIAAAFGNGPSEIRVKNPGEKPWVNVTLKWFKKLGISYENEGFENYRLKGGAQIAKFHYRVPADWSSALYPIAAALITHSEVTLEGVDFEEAQGDKEVVALLKNLGARLEAKGNRLHVLPGPCLEGQTIDVAPFIDATPMLAVLACFSKKRTEFIGASIARHKECNRLASIVLELKKMGAKIEERPDGLVVDPSPLRGGRVKSWGDHRMAMALTVAALGAEGKTEIEGVAVVAKSFPDFFSVMQHLGAKIE
jgi:3-phosphoshikimate 1-carboxyvinyltransferase